MSELPYQGFRSRRLFVWMFLALLAVGIAFVLSLRVRPAYGDEPPAGYKSLGLIKLAILTGQLPLIDPKPPLPETIELTEGIEYGRAGDRITFPLPKQLLVLLPRPDSSEVRSQKPPYLK